MPKQLSRFRYPPDDKLGTEAFSSYVEQFSQTDRDRLITSVRGSGTSILLPTNDPMTTDASVPGNGSTGELPNHQLTHSSTQLPRTSSVSLTKHSVLEMGKEQEHPWTSHCMDGLMSLSQRVPLILAVCTCSPEGQITSVTSNVTRIRSSSDQIENTSLTAYGLMSSQIDTLALTGFSLDITLLSLTLVTCMSRTDICPQN